MGLQINVDLCLMPTGWCLPDDEKGTVGLAGTNWYFYYMNFIFYNYIYKIIKDPQWYAVQGSDPPRRTSYNDAAQGCFCARTIVLKKRMPQLPEIYFYFFITFLQYYRRNGVNTLVFHRILDFKTG